MKSKGRKAEEKPWDTTYRHSFYTSYAQDPDLHVLMFVSGTAMNSILREALRDYMRKHASRAADPEFQRQVFMIACQKTADGHPPIGSEVLRDMHEPVPQALTLSQPAYKTPTPAPRVEALSPAPFSAQVISGFAESSFASPEQTAQRTQPDLPPGTLAVPTQRKPPVTLDFGPDPEIVSAIEDTPSTPQPKVSQRDRWLARHKN